MSARSLSSLVAIALLSASCNTIRLHRADKAFGLMQYPKAEGIYERVLSRRDDRAARARLADAYLSHNKLDRAIHHYALLHAVLPLTGDTGIRYGSALMGLGRSQEAADILAQVLQRTPDDRRAQDLLRSAQDVQSFYADSGRYSVNLITIPGVRSVFAPVPFGNDLLVAAVPEKARYQDPWSGEVYMDLMRTTADDAGRWRTAEPLPGTINGNYHEGSASISKDGNTIYFTRSNYVKHRLMKDADNTSHLMLFRATRDSSGQWGDLRAFAHNGESWSTGHPALSSDGRTLYFASDRPGGSGGMDIWRCRDTGTGWSEPENLGPVVNTPGNELFPTINGDALHFSSTGHLNMGGLDILETREENGSWSAPRNPGHPINTTHDDMHFVLNGDSAGGYLSSDRSGVDQVYVFTVKELLFHLQGQVVDGGGVPLPGIEVVIDEPDGTSITLVTDANGRFGTRIAPNSEYTVKAQGEGLLAASAKASTKGLVRSDTLSVLLQLDRALIGSTFTIENIYYDFDQWDIRPDAAVELDRVAGIFISNPHLTFELSSHTDSRGSDAYNLVLSDARANSAVNYLIRHGVPADRITARGYGERSLINACSDGVPCTGEEHQANRRTEFKVTGIIDKPAAP
jgi:outer membrane protein OmpA-like peptidoglycan-associated protein